MHNTKIADVFQLSNRFMRSVHLERDFSDSSVLNDYILTPHAQSNLTQLMHGLSPNSGQRAWRITGDYGSGKSSFALALAHLLSGRQKELPKSFQRAIDFRKVGVDNPKLLPVLVTGSREKLSTALLRALKNSLETTSARSKSLQVIKQIESLTESDEDVSEDTVIELLQDTNDYVCGRKKGTGLLIILDELGKFLEYAALYPDQQDIYFLQRLAETASRSGSKPIFIVGLLHQGFNAYADQLSQVSQREWEKVAGRFEELLFNQPLEQIATLIGNVLNVSVDRLPKSSVALVQKEMSSVLNLGWYGPGASQIALTAEAAKLYPLHPTMLPILVRFFSRFGQNERSIFSFLLSNEPFGLRDFSEQTIQANCFYRIHNFYDYARATFGHRLSAQSYRSHWNQIESVVESFTSGNETELQILKTVAILNLLDTNTMLASEEAIDLSVENQTSKKQDSLQKTISALQKKKRLLYYRGAAGGYCLWPHTSVNLENAYDEASKALGTLQGISSHIKDELETRPLVARRHYIETGNLRHFNVKYVPMEDLASRVEVDYASSDGTILVPLCETDKERIEACKFAGSSAFKKKKNILIAVPKPLSNLTGLVLEFKKWEWIAENIPELNHDSYAAEEVSRRITASRQVMQKRIQSFVGLRQFTEKMELQWYQQGKEIQINSGRELLSMLSTICDDVYKKAPIIRNELVNRRNLSSAAASARMRLIERLFKHPSEPYLGMDPDKKPPEMSMYLSVLKASKLHQETDNGYGIIIDEKEDPFNLCLALNRVLILLKKKSDSRVCVSDIFDILRQPPFGVRDGLHPLLLSVFAVVHEHALAFYEDGVFVRHISGEDFPRIVKAPETFEVQYCSISSVRNILFEQLLSIIGQEKAKGTKKDLLDVVRPLCVFAAQLPAYTHKTNSLSKHTLAVRDVLRKAADPIALVFKDLPAACEFEPFEVKGNADADDVAAFVKRLKKALKELNAAYPELLESIKDDILESFHLPKPFEDSRKILATTADSMVVAVNEPQLKALCLRLKDMALPEKEWLESLGSLVNSKPPSKWIDSDRPRFTENLKQLAAQFKRVESIAFDAKKRKVHDSGVRIAVTRSDGAEVDQVLYISDQDEKKIAELEKTVVAVLKKSGNLGLVAASRAIWNSLSQEPK